MLRHCRTPTRRRRAMDALPAVRAALLVKPDAEEVVELATADALGGRDEVRGRHVAVAVLRVPGAQDAVEDVVSDLLAQRLQGHRAAVVDGRVEELGRAREGGRCG